MRTIDKIKELIIKLGGTPSEKPRVNDQLDKLCGCQFGVKSWNDLTDRPFGEEVVTTTVFEKQIIELFAGSGGRAFLQVDMVENPLVEGDTYLVEWNGAKYELVAKRRTNASFDHTYLGNSKYDDNMNFDDGDNTPFCISWHNTYGGHICFSYGEEPNWSEGWEDVEVGIWALKTVITTLDPKYLPKAEAVADVTEAPTAENFNALLASLRAAGYLNS